MFTLDSRSMRMTFAGQNLECNLSGARLLREGRLRHAI